MKTPPSKIRCPRCGLHLSPDRFYKSTGRRPYGLSSSCKKCERVRLDKISSDFRKGERLEDPEKRQARLIRSMKNNLKRKFGIDLEQYWDMVNAAKGVCEICGKVESQIHHATGEAQNLSVDHDETTGKIRGILCSTCNRGIGFLQHDKQILQAAIKYLETRD